MLLLLGVNWLTHIWLRPDSEVLLPINFALFAVAAVAHLILSFRHKCPACGKHPTIQGFAPPHSDSIDQSRLSGWGGVIVNVIRRRRLVCIHCGKEYHIQ
jgi:hypothetical protein